MVAVVSLLFIIVVSMLIMRTAAVVLEITGLSQSAARFQARSAFTGVGFTTSESEGIVNHPVRRQVVKTLMLLGNLGLVTIASTSIVTLIGVGSSESPLIVLGGMLVGLALLSVLAYSTWVDRLICRVIETAIVRFTSFAHGNRANLLQLHADHGVWEFWLREGSMLCGSSIGDSGLREEGIVVLGVTRKKGDYIAIPSDDVHLVDGDNLILHGANDVIAELDRGPGAVPRP